LDLEKPWLALGERIEEVPAEIGMKRVPAQ
jgi:hypothetical protein